VHILRRAADSLIFSVTIDAALMAFENIRQYVVGLSARPLLANLIAGVQLQLQSQSGSTTSCSRTPFIARDRPPFPDTSGCT